MTIVSVILLMVLLIAVAQRTQHLGLKQYLIIILITLIQVGIFVFFMFTMEQPPTY